MKLEEEEEEGGRCNYEYKSAANARLGRGRCTGREGLVHGARVAEAATSPLGPGGCESDAVNPPTFAIF